MASAVVHLRCQIDEPKGCPDSWKKCLCVHMREWIVVQKRLLESVYGGRKKLTPPQHQLASSNPLSPHIKQIEGGQSHILELGQQSSVVPWPSALRFSGLQV